MAYMNSGWREKAASPIDNGIFGDIYAEYGTVEKESDTMYGYVPC
jgi:hypothetical protein